MRAVHPSAINVFGSWLKKGMPLKLSQRRLEQMQQWSRLNLMNILNWLIRYNTHNADEKFGAEGKAWHLFQPNHPFDDLVDADVPLKTSKGSRSQNILLDDLSIPCKTISTNKDRYRCAFKGCQQSWAGIRQAVRMYKHIEHEWW